MLATINPVVPSLLTSDPDAKGGAVHGEVTCATKGEPSSRLTMSVPTARAALLCAPSAEPTVISSCWSPCPNLPANSWEARADAEVGSSNPPADRLLATGRPNTAAPITINNATAMMRRGARMPSRAMPSNTFPPFESRDLYFQTIRASYDSVDATGHRSGSEPQDRALDGEPRPERQQPPVISAAGLVDADNVFEHQQHRGRRAVAGVGQHVPTGAQLPRPQRQLFSQHPQDLRAARVNSPVSNIARRQSQWSQELFHKAVDVFLQHRRHARGQRHPKRLVADVQTHHGVLVIELLGVGAQELDPPALRRRP